MQLLSPALDFALPARCAGCGTIVSDDGRLCGRCWQSLEFLTGGGCDLCGVPLPESGPRCAQCLAAPPIHDGARAAVVYGEVSRHIALRLKHGRRIGLARQMAALMSRQLPGDADLLIPVPLHRWRIWSRGFNQSALIAGHLARRTGIPASLETLKRVKPTPLLRGLSARSRSAAVRGAFAVPAPARDRIKGRHLVLVDDVYTSGATANACARVLKRAGASRVTLLSWARVLIGDGLD